MMKINWHKKYIFLTISFICIIILFFWFYWTIHTFKTITPIAENSVIEEITNSDNSIKAIKFIRDAGATTRESYQLSLVRPHQRLGNAEGNIFISYSDFHLEWIDDKTLIVTVYSNSQIFKQEETFKDFRILYKFP